MPFWTWPNGTSRWRNAFSAREACCVPCLCSRIARRTCCSGGNRNVFTQKCRMDGPHLERVLRFKNNAMRGGLIENVYLRYIQAGQVAASPTRPSWTYA